VPKFVQETSTWAKCSAVSSLSLAAADPFTERLTRSDTKMMLVTASRFVKKLWLPLQTTYTRLRRAEASDLARFGMRHFATPLVGVVPALLRYHQRSAKTREPLRQAQ
jgi:hypothetical protein